MKYMSKPKSAVVKDLILISLIFWVRNIDIGKGDIDLPLIERHKASHGLSATAGLLVKLCAAAVSEVVWCLFQLMYVPDNHEQETGFTARPFLLVNPGHPGPDQSAILVFMWPQAVLLNPARC